MTLYDHLRILLGTCCLALAAHPYVGTVTTVRNQVDCQIMALAKTNVINSDATFHCGGAEIPLGDYTVHMGLASQASRQRSLRQTTRWLRCRLTEHVSPIAFGLLDHAVTRNIASCRPLMVAPTPRRWICFNADRLACLA